jgi:hypothetical protein
VGTQVVTRLDIRDSNGATRRPRGSVGVITVAPQDSRGAYRIRFADGTEARLRRGALSIRKEFQREGLTRADLDDEQLRRYIVYRCVVGSRAYGLDEPTSDVDRRGVYVPPAAMHWSLAGVPEQLEFAESQECYWEVGKFLVLALKANPNVLECLYTPLVELATPMVEELLAMRSIFLSRLIYQTYNSYVMSQFRKLEGDLRSKGEVRWKHAMHLIRLLLSGITVLREGFVPLNVEEHRDRLMAIRRGDVHWNEVNDWRLALHREFDDSFVTTRLPERPDFERANAFLVNVRASMV